MAPAVVDEAKPVAEEFQDLPLGEEAPERVQLRIAFQRLEESAQPGSEAVGPEIVEPRLTARPCQEPLFVEPESLPTQPREAPTDGVEAAKGKGARGGREPGRIHGKRPRTALRTAADYQEHYSGGRPATTVGAVIAARIRPIEPESLTIPTGFPVARRCACDVATLPGTVQVRVPTFRLCNFNIRFPGRYYEPRDLQTMPEVACLASRSTGRSARASAMRRPPRHKNTSGARLRAPVEPWLQARSRARMSAGARTSPGSRSLRL